MGSLLVRGLEAQREARIKISNRAGESGRTFSALYQWVKRCTKDRWKYLHKNKISHASANHK